MYVTVHVCKSHMCEGGKHIRECARPIYHLLVTAVISLFLILSVSFQSVPASELTDDNQILTPKNQGDMQSNGFPPSRSHQGSNPQVNWQLFNSPDPSGNYSCIQFEDFDLDGKLDMVAGNSDGGISMWTGDGLGNWIAFPPPTTSLLAYDLGIDDLNNDGVPDLVIGHERGMLAWTGDGTGIWNNISSGLPYKMFGFQAPTYSIALDDMDLDGNIDIVSGNNGRGGASPIPAIRVFLGDGSGGWTEASNNLPALNGWRYFGVITGDFNKDGWPDIAGAGTTGVDAWIGDDGSTWTLRDNGLATGAFSDVCFADFNLDGNLDIVATGRNNNGVVVWNGDGWGTWTMTFNLPTTGSYTGVEVYDVNIDGFMDIITSCDDSDDVVWTGDGQDNWYPQVNGLRAGDSHYDISIGDINNDGRIDMCLLNTSGEPDVWISEVERTVNAWVEFNAPAITGLINDIEIIDINLDGKQDICYAMEGEGIEIWSGDGTGNWTALASPVTIGNYYSIISVDFNKDGMPDIISTSDAGVKAWTGDGGSTWSQLPPGSGLPLGGTYLGLVSADFNDDGNLDIAAGSDFMGVTVWNGDGGAFNFWTMTFNLPFFGTYYDLAAGDINHDGAIDLAAADGGLKVFLGDANNGWVESSGTLPDDTNEYYSVELADLNNDDAMDIIGASESNGVNTWLGDGSGAWTYDSNVIADPCTGLAVGDFSIDGSRDIVAGSSFDAGLNGNKQAAGWADVSNGLFQAGDFTTIKLADINIDGRLDIITTNYTAGTPHIWIGQYVQPSYSIGPLQVGWNMISLPLVPENSTMPDVLIDLDGDTTWSRMKLYEPLDLTDPWKSYDIAKPDSLQEISDIDITNGIWVFIPDMDSLGDGFIRIEGQEPTTTAISLTTGWNLIGYPSMTPEVAANTLPASADIISVFDAGQPYLIRDETDLNLVTMNDGEAYWVHVSSDCIWNVNW